MTDLGEPGGGAKMLRPPTWSSPHVTSWPGCVIIG
jgi:hypothetical protein